VTENRSAVIDVLDDLTAGGATNIGSAIERARQLLVEGRSEVPQIMIVLTDGVNSAGSGPVLTAAINAKSDGIVLIAVCAGGECDPVLPQAASDPTYYFSVPDAADLLSLFEQLGAQLIRSVTTLQLEDHLAPWIGLSALPARPLPDAAGADWLRWRFDLLPVGGISLTHQIVPQRIGVLPVSRFTTIEYTTYGPDGQPAEGRAFLGAPRVEVIGTPTPGPSLPTLGPPPLHSPTPTATAERPPSRAFLPRLDRG
jgi:hypothetical protein